MFVLTFSNVAPHTQTPNHLVYHTWLAKKRLRQDSREPRGEPAGGPTSDDPATRVRRKREAELKSLDAKRKAAFAARAAARAGAAAESGATTQGLVIPESHVMRPLLDEDVTYGADGACLLVSVVLTMFRQK